MIPRIRGKVGVIEDPPELAGKFAFEISLWDLSGENKVGDSFGPFGPFDTEEQALVDLKIAVQSVSQKVEKSMTGEISGEYLDMKNGGVMRPWVNQ